MDKKIPLHKKVAFQEINKHFISDNAKQQCARLLLVLRKLSINTFKASRGLGVYHPPARILRLRQQGHKINTVWQTIIAENGDKHRVGCYVLGSGGTHE